MLRIYKTTKPIAKSTIAERNALKVIHYLPWDTHKDNRYSIHTKKIDSLSRADSPEEKRKKTNNRILPFELLQTTIVAEITVMWQMEEILKVLTGFFSSQRTVDGRPALTNERVTGSHSSRPYRPLSFLSGSLSKKKDARREVSKNRFPQRSAFSVYNPSGSFPAKRALRPPMLFGALRLATSSRRTENR